MEKFFKLRERGTSVKVEIIAGLTTFMTMCYILMVNAGMFSELGVVSYGAVYIATAISAVVGTVLIGLLANLPLAQASGMGLNAYFVYTCCFTLGFSYANSLVFILFDGLIFVLLTVTGLRRKLFEAIPKPVRTAIPAGIGLFIAFIGFQNSGIVVADAATAVNLHSFNLLGGVTWGEIMPMFVTFISIILIAVLDHKKVRGAVVWGILGGAVLYYVLGVTVPGFYTNLGISISNPFAAFKEFGSMSFGKVFTEGFDFSAYIEANGTANFVIVLISTSIAFCMVDLFDTIGTLYGACSRGKLIDAEGNIPKMDQALLADAIATCTGAICGTSTVTTFVESASGVAAGGRTGLTSIVTAVLFFIAMFLSPIAQLIPSCACAAALVYVGILMMNGVKDIDWTSADVAVPAFLTLVIMPFTYNISYGIGLGLISYVVIKVFSGKVKEVKPTTWVITVLFLAMFLLTH